MKEKRKILLIGESWMIHTMEVKGFDMFSFDRYETGIRYIKAALSSDETEFYHMPCHMVDAEFPDSVEGLQKYDVIMLSDVGANTFLLGVETFLQGKRTKNKLELLKEYVLSGGGLCMVGGYLTFMGIEGKGKYHNTPIEEVLPVRFLTYDDREEHPEGVTAKKTADHPIMKNLPDQIHGFLGYNRAAAKEEATVLLQYEKDPILSIAEYGKGRSAAFASDCAPHWSPEEFCGSETYRILWNNIVTWLANDR